MNDWENDSLKKSSVADTSCHCSDMKGLYVPNRQLSFVVAGIIFALFATFMTGYFLGQRSAVAQFTHQIHQDSFADQIYASVFSLAENQEHDDSGLHDAANTPVPINTQQEQQSIVVQNVQDNVQDKAEPVLSEQPVEHDASTSYYAQLIGFGTAQAANRFVRRLAQKGVTVQSKKRVSKTAKGRTIAWYQVVTPHYTDKTELEAFVSKLSKEEKLKDVRIITC